MAMNKQDADCIRRAKELMPHGLQDVLEERYRQDVKWGEQNHDPITYLSILMEEVGELAQAALHARFGGPKAAALREEALHTAAVALAIVECLDRKKWHWESKGGVIE